MRLLPVCLLFLISSGLQAGSAVQVSTVGNVWTNHVALPSGHFAREGDGIRTDDTGLAVLTTPETGRFEVRQGSEVTWLDASVRLDSGTVASSRLPVEWGEYEIVPAKLTDDSWFVVSDVEGETLVAAYRGDVVIRGGGGAFTVPAGSFAMAAGAAPAPAASPRPEPQARQSDEEKKKSRKRSAARRRTGRANSAGSNKGWSLGGMGHVTSVALVTGVAAAAVTGLAGSGGRDEPVSPQ